MMHSLMCQRVLYTEDAVRILFFCGKQAGGRVLEHGGRIVLLCDECADELEAAGIPPDSTETPTRHLRAVNTEDES